jgi:hypothetical protein
VVRRAAVSLAFSLALLAGCGNSRTQPPDLSRSAAPHGTRTVEFAAAGVSFRAPRNWGTVPGQSPLVATVGSGRAIVSLWRYPRSELLPSNAAALDGARLRLIDAARARDPRLRLIRARVMTVDGAPAIELDAFEHIASFERRVRSVHVYAFGAELVLDEYAPADVFRAVDHQVFSPLKRSLRLFPAAAA